MASISSRVNARTPRGAGCGLRPAATAGFLRQVAPPDSRAETLPQRGRDAVAAALGQARRAVDEVLADADAGNADRRPAALLGPQAGDGGLTHEALDALSPDALALGHDQLGLDARRSVDLAVRLVDRADALGQPSVLDGAL